MSPRRGLVLGGGGVLGAAWMIGAMAGVRDVLGWEPHEADVLVGTSAGSVLAAMLSSGLDVDTLLAHQRGEPLPDDRGIDFDHDRASGGAMPPRPKLGIGSRSLVVNTVLHPRRLPLLAGLSGLLPHGRGTLEPVGALVDAAIGGAAWPDHPRTMVVAMDYDGGRRVAFGRDGAPPAQLADAVMASCAIPGWYAPVQIDGRRYVDGGTCSPTSVDLVADCDLDEVVVLAPMASFDYDEPSTLVGRVERRFRRVMTRRVLHEAGKVRRRGASVTILGPGREDLAAIGVNLMDPRRRMQVLETSLRTSAAALAVAPTLTAAAG
jgi:NTE family protein